jgi:hypothetical protein
MSIAPPSIAVTLALKPPSFKLGTDVELSATAVSKATYPITIFTWPSVFNLKLALRRGNFVGADQGTGMKLALDEVQFMRDGYDHTLGGRDDEYHVTLEPGQPMRFNHSLYLADVDVPASCQYVLPEGRAELLPGHQYLLDIRKDYYDSYVWWKKGRKEDVLDLPGQERGGYEADGKHLVLSLDEPVEFKVLPLDD